MNISRNKMVIKRMEQLIKYSSRILEMNIENKKGNQNNKVQAKNIFRGFKTIPIQKL